MTELTFDTIDLSKDEAPPMNGVTDDSFDPAYPGSTPEAPYGFKDDGTAYKRRPGPRGPRKSSGRGNMPASESQARSAAAMLGQLNNLIGLSLFSFGFPLTAGEIAKGNDMFVEQAYAALLTDPALCRKILSAGAQSGKAALVMAYGTLALGIAPALVVELKERRAAAQAETEQEAAA